MNRLVALLGLILLLCPVAALAAEEVAVPAAEAPTAPGGYVSGPRGQFQSAGDVFGAKTGYVHPYLSVGQVYTDNFFNTPDNEEEEWTTVVTPGIWGAFPAMKQRPEKVATLNTAPGGMPLTRFREDTGRRFQSYGGYSADFHRNKNFDDEEETTQRGEGLIDVNLRGGLGFDLMGVYENTHDPYSTGTNLNPQTDSYTSWTFDSIISYDVGPKTDVSLNLGYYTLSYDKNRNDFRDRDDLSAGFTAGYKVTEKLRVFGEFNYVDIDYDQQIQDDSEEYRYFAGVTWKLTEKSSGLVKAGYGRKDFSGQNNFENKEDMIGEIQLSHQFSPKTALNFTATRQTNESDIAGTDDRLSDYVGLALTQQMTAKTSLKVDASYLNDTYSDKITFGTKTDYRDDDYLQFGVGVGWSALDWLNVTLGYKYDERDSNFSEFDYENNTAYLNMTATM